MVLCVLLSGCADSERISGEILDRLEGAEAGASDEINWIEAPFSGMAVAVSDMGLYDAPRADSVVTARVQAGDVLTILSCAQSDTGGLWYGIGGLGYADSSGLRWMSDEEEAAYLAGLEPLEEVGEEEHPETEETREGESAAEEEAATPSEGREGERGEAAPATPAEGEMGNAAR